MRARAFGRLPRLATSIRCLAAAGFLAGGVIAAHPGGKPGPTSIEFPLVIVNGTVIDGTGREPLRDAVVIVRGKTIETVGRRAIVGIPPNATVIDAGGGTILPGFMNAHVHDGFSERNLEAWVRAGVTTVRDAGLIASGDLGDFLRRRADWATQARLARLVSAGRMIAPPAGYGTQFARSPEDARRIVDEEAAVGVEQVKFSLEDGYGRRSDLPVTTPEVAAAIVAAAHARGKTVSVHVTEAAFAEKAVAAGADDIGHVTWDPLPERVVRAMVERNTHVTPTLTVFEAYGTGAGAASTLRQLLHAGVKIALGNDYTDAPQNNFPHFELGMPMFEIRKMADAGMTPMAIIVAATRHAAEVCGLERALGTLEAGKTADILVVDGDPLTNLAALAAVRAVVHGGVVVRYAAGGGAGVAGVLCRNIASTKRAIMLNGSGRKSTRSTTAKTAMFNKDLLPAASSRAVPPACTAGGNPD